MNIAELAIKNRLWCVIVMMISLFGGLFAYNNMPRFEDPEFTIRTAQVLTRYPGATPAEVADEVTEKLETAIQQMQEVDEIRSTSSAGFSLIQVDIKFDFAPDDSALDVIWNRLRAKVDDAQAHLPPGAGPSLVNDDFADVYGLYYVITGDEFTHKELVDYAKDLRVELLTVPGVGKVQISGAQQETIYLEFSREQAAAMGVSLNSVFDAISKQNVVTPAGDIVLGDKRVQMRAGGAADSVEALKNTIIATGGNQNLMHLRDIAKVKRGYSDPPTFIMRYNGSPALGLGVSAVSGGNVVKLSKAINAMLKSEEKQRPLGIEIHTYYNQGDIVEVAINDFALNVLLALVIVLVTLFLFMGFRASMVIGAVLLFTIAATLAVMYLIDIPMHRVSLGALIIALGMLVDNAIVVTDGILVGLRKGNTLLATASATVARTFWPLLGGTLVGIIAFAPIGFAPGEVAEFTGDLFWVILISLLFSWVFAIILVPFLASLLFTKKRGVSVSSAQEESRFSRLYKRFIRALLGQRALVLVCVAALFALCLWGFKFVTPGFFPASTTPQMVVDFWLPEGTDIETTNADIKQLEKYLREQAPVKDVQALIGAGTMRYMLIYSPEANNSSYAQLLVKTQSYEDLDSLIPQVQGHIDEHFPDALAKVWRFKMGPGGGSLIEAEFSGPDPKVLRELAEKAKAIMLADGEAISIKDDWRNQVPILVAEYAPGSGRRAGVSRERVAYTMNAAYSGTRVGVYREDDKLIPIVARALPAQRKDVSNIGSLPLFNNLGGKSILLSEVVDGFDTEWENPRIIKRNRKLTIKAQCDPRPPLLAGQLQTRLQPQIEAIDLPDGYTLTWRGESGDSAEAQEKLATTIPLGFMAMVLVVILLFNALRQALVIWLTVPLALMGVVFGLLVTNSPLEFMAILGVLSLSGLLIKNAIVLVDQMDADIATGKPRLDAIVDAAQSRVQPVLLGAVTTVLGILPLFWDAFFKSMSVVLAFGLSFATLLTLLVVPVLYAVIFRVKPDEVAQRDSL